MHASLNDRYTSTPCAAVRDDASGKWLLFSNPQQVLTARTPEQVTDLLQEVEQAVEIGGLHAAGFVAYEAAPGFDACLSVKDHGGFLLAWFGLFRDPVAVPSLPAGLGVDPSRLWWRPSLDRQGYARAITTIKHHLLQGDSYQVNFTYRMRAGCLLDPWELFLALADDRAAPFAAYLDIGEWVVCSLSPELFFRLDGRDIASRPMKGTAPRGLWFEDDQARAEALRSSPKERAENVMIVDMVRNDLGRIAEVGSVRVPSLFTLEQYPTLWQMTSTVSARTRAGLPEIFRGLFPPASITGAPKARTMQIIADLEDSPRRVYTGCAGFVSPKRRAQFNVAIRTLLVHRGRQTAEYGVGGGVVWDSTSDSEFEESLLKARVLFSRRPVFDLLETLLWSPGQGWVLLEHHLQRLSRSAEYFGFAFDRDRTLVDLVRLVDSLPPEPHRVRLLVSRSGAVRCESRVAAQGRRAFQDIRLAAVPVDRHDPFLYHKTTNRRVYERVLASSPGCTDVLMYNESGEITESTLANAAFALDGELCTPPVSCGLLPGTCRADLLQRGMVRERVVTVQQALQVGEVLLMNAVRGAHKVQILGERISST